MSLKRALLSLVVLVLAVGTVPAGIIAHGFLGRALNERVRESLAMAPELLGARWQATVDVRMMHARDVARTPGLAEALMQGEESQAARMVEQAGAGFPEAPLLLGSAGESLIPAEEVPEPLLEATRRGEMPVAVVPTPGQVRVVSLAPVEMEGAWVGAAGGTSVLDEAEAAMLAGLTRSQVLILDNQGGVVAASSPLEEAESLARSLVANLENTASRPSASSVPGGEPTGEAGGGSPSEAEGGAGTQEIHESILEVRVDTGRYLLLAAPFGDDAEVWFLKDLNQELAVLPLLRGIALWSAGITLALALVLGTLFAGRLARPVGSLADAADQLAKGDFDAPLQPSGVSEVNRVSDAFDQMRRNLRARVRDLEKANIQLEEANRELEDRQERLLVLQAELVQRDRLASTGRLLAQLAHEIRNPIASIRNCLEVLRRRTASEPEAQAFADMAIDELLRMHELTEQMLDVHRPRDRETSSADVVQVAQEVASLLKAGANPGKVLSVSVVGPARAEARIGPDSLKQVLLNLGLNASEAMEEEGPIEIVVDEEEDRILVEVLDRGPGVPEGILSRIFDPFFTTKSQVHGVGLGLFTAEAIVRTYGGKIQAANRSSGPGARFSMAFLKAGDPSAVSPSAEPAEDGDSDA